MPFGTATSYPVEGEGPAGALELLHPGRGWSAHSLGDDRARAQACLFGGLRFYESPTEGPP